MMYDVDVTMEDNMTRTQILLEESQHRWLIVQARRQQKSLSQVLRELVDAQRTKFIRKRHDDPLFRLVGMGPDRVRDVAEQHDRYLYGSSKRRAS